MTKDEFKKIIARIETAWNTSFDDLRKEIYAENIADLDYQGVLLAVKKLIQTEKYPPTIAHIREAYAQANTPQTSMVDCLAIYNRITQHYGRYRHLEGMVWLQQENVAIYEIVKAIGYANICNDVSNIMRNELGRLYKEASRDLREQSMLSGRLKSELAKISGKIEQQATKAVGCDDY